jgi:hypothetical protein
MLSYRSHLQFRPAPLRLVYSYEGSQRYTWPRIHGCRGRYVPRCYESKSLSVNSVDLGSRWQTARIERCKLGKDTFQDASD